MRPRLLLLAAVAALVAACSTNDADHSRNNELNRTLSFDGQTLTLTDSGGTLSVDLSSLQNDADADPSNELITDIALNGTNLDLTEGGNQLTADLGFLKNDADADPANELQTLAYDSGTAQLSISSGNTVQLPAAQTLSILGDQLSISGGNSVTLPSQTLTYDSSTGDLSISGGNTVNIPGYRRTVIVSPVGNDLQNGTALRSALAGISASATSPALLIIEPGVYDIGSSNGLQLRSYIDVQGSGQGVTKITGTVPNANNGIVLGAANMELRDLTIEQRGPSTGQSVAFYAFNLANVKLTRVTVNGLGGPVSMFACYLDSCGRADLTDVTCDASGGAASSQGLWAYGGTIYVRDSTMRGTTYAMTNPTGSTTFRVANTLVDGVAAGGGFACVGAFNASYAALGTGCN